MTHDPLLYRIAPDHEHLDHTTDSLGWHTVSNYGPSWESSVSTHPKKKIVVYHHGFATEPGSGNALRTVQSLIAARDAGYKSARIHSALGGHLGNGAYTFPRIGFTTHLPTMLTKHYHDRPEGRKVFGVHPSLEWAHQLVEGGRAPWWKKNHSTLYDLHFDLTPGSDSFKRLEGYLRERKAEGR